MLEFTRRVGRTALFVGLVLVPTASFAGTGSLLSKWMSRAPSIDATIEDGEWDEATSLDMGQGVTAHIGNDGRTLYVAVLDPRLTVPSLNRIILFIEDEGGAVPLLDDDAWTTAVCQSDADLGEGEIWFEYSEAVNFYEWRTDEGNSSFCPAQPLESRIAYAVTFRQGPWGVTYEIALPLDGPGPLHAAPGQLLGFELRVLDNTGGNDLCYPACVIDPPSFSDLILASGGCNTGPQGFGSGQPQIGLPLDWSSVTSSGTGWRQSTVFADPVFCQDNVTGGAGAAACASDALYGGGENESLLTVPVSLAGQTTAKMRLRAYFEPGLDGAFLRFGARLQDTNISVPLAWEDFHGGQALEIDLPMAVGNLPIELAFWHATGSGAEEGGFAEVDDVELLCGPILFADDFESRLTTHWSATTP